MVNYNTSNKRRANERRIKERSGNETFDYFWHKLAYSHIKSKYSTPGTVIGLLALLCKRLSVFSNITFPTRYKSWSVQLQGPSYNPLKMLTRAQ